ncbi:hypothetical protein WA026_002547 [Henosepilachna vigintioctopunctata]|uniref:Uncharacterized protein n=1 Tax=Henosepilachna vigintioctopunctata TaxID=420089 RepID=A0AAW1TV27_9CUCU
MQEEDGNVGESGVRKLSLGEIGYGLAKVAPTATYVDVPPPTPALEAGVCKDSRYVPGSVTINNVPKYETVELPTDSGLNSYITESQSSSSHRASQASKVLLERLECGCGNL